MLITERPLTMRMPQEMNKSYLPFFLFYVFCFMGIAIFTSFINVYFYQLGFPVSQIGILTALGPLISMVSQPMWGILSDRTNKRRVLMIVLAGAAVMSLIIPINTSFLWLIIVLLIYWSFATSLLPLGDAITLQFLEGKAIKYSALRVVGAIGFGLPSIFAGLLIGGNIGRIFYYNAFFLTVTFILVSLMPAKKKVNEEDKPQTDGQEQEQSQVQNGFGAVAALIKNKVVLCVYLSSFVFGLAMSFLHNFIGIRMTALGAHEGQVGIALFIAAFSEVPLFLIMDRVFAKHKPEHLLMLSAFFMGLRLFIMYLGNSIMLIYLAQVFHGFSFIIHLYFCIVLLHKHSPPHIKSTVQTVHAMIRMGVGAILGGLGGGFLAQHIGMQSVFLLLSVIVFSTCFALPGVLILIHKSKKRNP